MTLNGKYVLVVKGVIDDLPQSSHIPFDALLSMKLLYARMNGGAWYDGAKDGHGFYTYVLLQSESSLAGIKNQLPDFIDNYFESRDKLNATEERQLVFQPLPEIHLRSKLEKELKPNGNLSNVHFLSFWVSFFFYWQLLIL